MKNRARVLKVLYAMAMKRCYGFPRHAKEKAACNDCVIAAQCARYTKQEH